MSLETSESTASTERSLNSQVVLEEDEYTAALSRIIARDFFPSLIHLDATNEYLDALRSRDPHLISASVRRIEEINATPIVDSRRSRARPPQTPSETPYGFGGAAYDTPLATPRGEPSRKKPRYDDSLSLDTFQARYTSEDNSSFTEILDNENKARKERWAWAWEAQNKSDAKQKLIAEGRERMLIEAPPNATPGVREKWRIEQPAVAGLIQGPEEEADKQVTLVSNDNKQRDVMAPPPPPRHNGMDAWTFKARNSLMFSPDADQSPYYIHKPSDVKPSDEKVMLYSNTRLPEQDADTSVSRPISEPPSPTHSRVHAAIQGTPYHSRSTGNSAFKLVPNLPSPTASELGPTAVKQLMTWGTLDATPRIISSTDEADLPPSTTPFHLPKPSRREQISQTLSNNASKSLRARAGLLGLNRTPGLGTSKRGNMLPPSTTPRKSQVAGNLTPAAKRLLDRTTMGALTSRRAEGMEKTSRWSNEQKEKDLKEVRWTPTPGVGGVR